MRINLALLLVILAAGLSRTASAIPAAPHDEAHNVTCASCHMAYGSLNDNGQSRGIVGAGSTGTTLVDTTQTWSASQWLGAVITFTSGANQGQFRTITASTANSLTWETALPAAAVAGTDTYQLSLVTEDDIAVRCKTCHNPTGMAPTTWRVGIHTAHGGSVSVGCGKCHEPHNVEPNSGVGNALIRSAIRWKSALATTVYPSGSANPFVAGAPNYNGICETCHTQTTYYRNDGTAGTGHNPTQACTDCHEHDAKFLPGPSQGHTPCLRCHQFGMNASENMAATTYHHVLGPAVTFSDAAQYLVSYPTDATGRTCVQCHVDHDVFRSDLNAANTLGLAGNLRSGIGNVPGAVPTAPGEAGGYWSEDQETAFAAGGLCLSCHTTAQVKDTTSQKTDGTTGTLALNKADFVASAHGYAGPQGSFANDPSGKTFGTVCVKCHNSDAAPNYQNGTYQFALHTSADRRLRAPLGGTASDNAEEKFCFRCHSNTTDSIGGTVKTAAGKDYYGATAMLAPAENLYQAFTGRPALPTSTVNTLYFKPSTQELPAEPMPNGPIVDTGTTFTTNALFLRDSAAVAPVEPMPNVPQLNSASTTTTTTTLYIKNASEVAAEPMPNAYLLASGTYDTSTYRMRMMTPQIGSAVESTVVNTTASSGVKYEHLVQVISPALASSYSLSSGQTITLNLRAVESNSNNNCYVRAQVYKWTAGDSGVTLTSVANSNSEISTSVGSRSTSLTTSSSSTFAAGDRFMIEVEIYKSTPTSTGTCTLTWGSSTENSSLVLPSAAPFNFTSGGYDVATYRQRAMTPDQGATAESVVSSTVSGAGVSFDRIAQFVSPPIATAFTWNSGATMTLAMRGVEDTTLNNNCNLRWQVYRWAAADSGASLTALTDSAELPGTVATDGTTYTATTSSSVTFAPGDKLVIEVENRKLSPTNTGTCTLSWGSALEDSRLQLPVTSLSTLPEFSYSSPPIGSSWAGRVMAPWVPTAASETLGSAVTVSTGTQLWQRATYLSPALAVAATLPAATWSLTPYVSESNSLANAYVRYRIYQWKPDDSMGAVVVPWTTYSTEMGTTLAAQAITTPTGAAATLNVGDKLAMDLEIETVAVLTGGTYTAQVSYGATTPSTLVAPTTLTFTYVDPFRAKASLHNVMAYSGVHRPYVSASDSGSENQAYINANKHVECEDCHDAHAAGLTPHVAGTNAVTPSSPLYGSTGEVPTMSSSNWTAPTAYSWTATVTAEFQICYKCHSGANTNLAAWGGKWVENAAVDAWMDVGLAFNTSNASYHPVAGALPATDPGTNGSSQLKASQLCASTAQAGCSASAQSWTPGHTMYCSDCHGNDAALPAAQGPHGSTVKYLLRGPNVYWPKNAAGALYALGSSNSRTGMFCLNCHPDTSTSGTNNVHTESHHNNAACVSCHIRVPHGGKMSRLIVDCDSGNMPARDFVSGTLGCGPSGNASNGQATMKSFTKNTSGNYSESNCQTACTTNHNSAQSENW